MTPVDIGDFHSTKAPSEAMNAVQAFMSNSDPFAIQEKASLPKVEAELKEDRSLVSPASDAAITEQALQDAVDMLDKLPEKTWEQRLKDVGIDKVEARTIIDAILSVGYYEKAYQLTAKTQVVFRTRRFDHQERVQRAIERDSPQYMGTVSLIMTKYNLAASLSQMGKNKFELDEDEKYTKSFAFISKLPFMLFNILIQKLSKFDQLVMTVMDEGALENF